MVFGGLSILLVPKLQRVKRLSSYAIEACVKRSPVVRLIALETTDPDLVRRT